MTPAPTARGHILFVSDSVPVDQIGSHIIFRRHLRRLVDQGWKLTVVSTLPAVEPECRFWRHVHIPMRQPWWPPVRRAVTSSVLLRAVLQARHVRKAVGRIDGPMIVIGNLWDELSPLARRLSVGFRCPLGIFAHDDEIHWNVAQKKGPPAYFAWKRRLVCGHADVVWSVSVLLARDLKPAWPARVRILRPIPEGESSPVAWREAFAAGLRVGYAGKTYGDFQKTLLRLAGLLAGDGGSLSVVTDPNNAKVLHRSLPNLESRPFFPSAGEAARWLREQCSALLVAHPLVMSSPGSPWEILFSSFPSKLPEYAQLGLPLILIGPPRSEFGHWAASRPDAPFFSDFSDPRLAAYLASLRTREGWETAAAWTRALARDEFDPARIHASFEADLASLLGRTASPL